MKLRNKKTGDTTRIHTLCVYADNEFFDYDTIDKLNEEWEDYKPAKPLIKDEKIRKAVRAWWETVPDVITDKRILYKKNRDLAVGVYSIFCGAIHPETLEVGNMYTITELCGDDE